MTMGAAVGQAVLSVVTFIVATKTLGVGTRGGETELQPDELWIHKTNAVIA